MPPIVHRSICLISAFSLKYLNSQIPSHWAETSISHIIYMASQATWSPQSQLFQLWSNSCWDERRSCADNAKDLELCPAEVKEEWGEWRLNDMFNVKCALFQVMVAKCFSSCIPVIREAGGVLRGWQMQTRQGYVSLHFCSRYKLPHWDPSMDDVTTQRYAGTKIPSNMSNVTLGGDKRHLKSGGWWTQSS